MSSPLQIDTTTPSRSRSPCPALNALANEGYLPSTGMKITLPTLIHSLRHVYNLSAPLATCLSLAAFITVGTLSFSWRHLRVNWTLDLKDLSQTTPPRCTLGLLRWKIAHAVSLAHFNPITLHHRRHHPRPPSRETTIVIDPSQFFPTPTTVSFVIPETSLTRFQNLLAVVEPNRGLTLHDLATARVKCEKDAEKMCLSPLDRSHDEIARGEAGLLWMELKNADGEIPIDRLRQFFGVEDVQNGSETERRYGHEKLPADWWENVRPRKTIGLHEASSTSGLLKKEMFRIRRAQRKLSNVGITVLSRPQVNM